MFWQWSFVFIVFLPALLVHLDQWQDVEEESQEGITMWWCWPEQELQQHVGWGEPLNFISSWYMIIDRNNLLLYTLYRVVAQVMGAVRPTAEKTWSLNHRPKILSTIQVYKQQHIAYALNLMFGVHSFSCYHTLLPAGRMVLSSEQLTGIPIVSWSWDHGVSFYVACMYEAHMYHVLFHACVLCMGVLRKLQQKSKRLLLLDYAWHQFSEVLLVVRADWSWFYYTSFTKMDAPDEMQLKALGDEMSVRIKVVSNLYVQWVNVVHTKIFCASLLLWISSTDQLWSHAIHILIQFEFFTVQSINFYSKCQRGAENGLGSRPYICIYIISTVEMETIIP